MLKYSVYIITYSIQIFAIKKIIEYIYIYIEYDANLSIDIVASTYCALFKHNLKVISTTSKKNKKIEKV